MKKIRIMLSYGSYPLWLYDEDLHMINFMSPYQGLPEEINDEETRQLCEDIQDTYESLFTNNKIEFCYNGFGDRVEDERRFIQKLKRLVDIITERLSDAYLIVNDIEEAWRS